VLTKEDIEIIRRLIDKCIANITVLETEKERIELNNEFKNIANKMTSWYDKNHERIINIKKMGKISDESMYNIHEIMSCHNEEYIELKIMYKDIIQLLK
jgi:hypothetical protein